MIEHDTIHHADCFDLMAQIDDATIDALISDLPYGSTACSWDTRVDLALWWAAVKRILKPRGVFVTTASQPFTSALVMSNPEWFRYEWIWWKTQASGHLNVHIMPLREHENILVFGKSGYRYFPQFTDKPTVNIRPITKRGKKTLAYGSYDDTTRITPKEISSPRSVIRIANVNGVERGLHPTQKPVALYEYLIRTYTQPGDLVLDPFCGSGTTALAAFRTGRQYLCGDSDAEYVTIAQERLANSDPYLDTTLPDGSVQLSLFSDSG